MPNLKFQPILRPILPLLAVCALPVAGLFAGPEPAAPDSKDKNVAQTVMDGFTPLNTLNVESSVVGEASFREKKHDGAGAATDDPYRAQKETQESFEYGHRFHLFDKVYLKLGASYERFDFSQTTAPIPTSLQSATGLVAVEYITQGKAAAFISSKPGVFYSDFDHIRKGAFDAPTVVASLIPVTKKLYILAGARFSLLAKYPVFPIGGVVWLISDNVTLKAVPPEPRLIVSLNKHLDVFGGGEILGESYKRDFARDARPQDQRFNGGVLDFTEYRLGGGLTYKPVKGVGLDFGGGWDLGRDFDYYRGDSPKRFQTHGAPYAKVALTAEF